MAAHFGVSSLGVAAQLKLDAESESMIDDLVASGRFAERADVLRHGVRLAYDEGQAAEEPLTEEEIAGVERGLADVAAGRIFSAAQVRAELERRHAARS